MRDTQHSAPGPSRYALLRLAAHLAHRLNTGEPLNPGVLYRHVVDLLSGSTVKAGAPCRYRDRLVCAHALGPHVDAEEAAVAYFERVFNRPLFLARTEPFHKAHALLLAHYTRAQAGEGRAARLERARHRSGVRPGPRHIELQAIAQRIDAAGLSGISTGNPARGTRERLGPLWLCRDDGAVEIPEELSLWGAIVAGPRQMEIVRGAAFDAYCSLMIKVLETAHAPWSALTGIGLSPLAWGEDVSTNTAKKMATFIACIPLPERASRSAWLKAWSERPVPGFADGAAFWSSEVGAALRSRQSFAQVMPIDEAPDIPQGADDDAELDWDAFPQHLAELAEAGVVDAYDVWLLKNLQRGKNFEQLSKSLRTFAKFGSFRIPESFVEVLLHRVRSRKRN